MKYNQQNEEQIPPKRKSTPVHRRPVQLLCPEQARILLAVGKEHGHEILLMLALVLGLRSHEMLALQWQAINWEAGSLQVRLTLPAQQRVEDQPLFLPVKYERMIPLSRTVKDCLQEHALRQQQEREQAGMSWQPHDLVLCTQQGHPLSSRYLTPIVQNFLRQAHLPVLRFHELRHTTAHLLLLSGIAPDLVGTLLGVGTLRTVGFNQLLPFSREQYEEVRLAMEQLFFEP